MNKWGMKGIVLGLCLSMMAPMAVAMVPGMSVEAAATTEIETTESDIKEKAAELKAYKISLKPNANQTARIDALLQETYKKIGYTDNSSGGSAKKDNCEYKSKQELAAYIAVVKDEMNNIVNPPKDDSKDDKDDKDDDTTVPVNADHFLTVGGNWVTPVANAGQPVSIVLPIVNMGKTNVTKAVVTPVLSTDTATWPFEITQSGYSQTIEDLPGTDTGMSDMDRRRELTWNLQTRSDVGNGYQKISFNVRYFASDGSSQTTTLDTYIQTSGTAGVSADGKASTPRVIVTGFETNPEVVHAGDSFMLTLHLKNTSTATSVNNMLFEFCVEVQKLLVFLRADLAGRDFRPELNDARKVFHRQNRLRLFFQQRNFLIELQVAAAQLRHAGVIVLRLFGVLREHGKLQIIIGVLFFERFEPADVLILEVHVRACLVDEVNGLIRQETVIDIARRQAYCCRYRIIRNLYLMMLFILFPQSL